MVLLLLQPVVPQLVGGDDCLVLRSLGGITDIRRLALSRTAGLLVGASPPLAAALRSADTAYQPVSSS